MAQEPKVTAWDEFSRELRKNAVLSKEYKDHLAGLVQGVIVEANRNGYARALEDIKLAKRRRAMRRRKKKKPLTVDAPPVCRRCMRCHRGKCKK